MFTKIHYTIKKMEGSVILKSNIKGEINKFLSKFYNTNLEIENKLIWQKKYANPIELAEIVGVYIDNYDFYNLGMFICIDKNLFISINNSNADDIIKYLYERFPY